jgi:hypothetical protein
MLICYLLSKLRARLPQWAFTATSQSVKFDAIHPDVGGIEIDEDGPELIVSVGNFTHAHFGNYDRSLSQEQAAEIITDNVLSFLEDIFTDRIVMWGSHRGGGGYYVRGTRPSSVLAKPRCQEYVWSGPLDSQEQG